MIRVIIHGCNGRMGRVVSGILSESNDMEAVAGIDVTGVQRDTYPVYSDIFECDVEADVIIDFASVAAVDRLLAYGVEKNLAIVLCTTGLSEDQNNRVKEASGKIPLLKSANMSLGINTVVKLLQQAAPVLADAGFDIEIVEKHHNQKKDAPSGTALLLADAINETMNDKYEYVYDRSKVNEKRGKNELGISAVRGGSIVGEHEVIFAGLDEVIEIKHTAFSRSIFANGAIQAAKFLAGRSAGVYSMADAINSDRKI
ncbi:4-hydroxy-tetrahydrodipicolinate reductase [Parasporobacterium paucivorans]|uniref:4-hydroxy-tetrahydrodipicolinate reductase n=1 Tax=Parasporobacterium paucivorans DSM 15970 TaxID=1122934 RepID=A0A1M6CBX0_9FIRM|nr:4-hydroxy-tetrahydrodipicolinate reductase [Parasporobacterium paucivorans]SHI58311.1 dihydrodipicolinate reductase [Parasporobacterium paucivorans DSM 15970]